MSNAEFVMVPRDTIEEICANCCHLPPTKSIISSLNEILAKPTEQHQGEPVALPERKGTHLRYDTLMPTFSKGWNACLTEIAKLGPLYEHADPGEVERLRLEALRWKGVAETLQVDAEKLSDDGIEFMTRAKRAEAEVDRLRAEIERMRERVTPTHKSLIGKHAEIIKERDTMRAQLAECEAMAAMIAEREWAEHVGTGPVSSKVEAALTQLHNDLHETGEKLAKQDALFGKYGDTLRPFVELMRKELEANNHKGDRNGWLQMDQQKAVAEIDHHVGKLHGALGHLDVEAVQEHAADIANCCMMFLDVVGLLDISASAEPSAPIEIDERAAFETEWWGRLDLSRDKLSGCYYSQATEWRWEGWKTRSDMERKP